MLTFVFIGLVTALATWSLVGLYFDSVLFDGIRRRVQTWEKSARPWKKRIGSGLECPYCLGHWVAGVLLLLLLILPKFEMLLLLFIAPKIAVALRENLLGPIRRPWDTSPSETGNVAGAVIEQQPDSERGAEYESERITRRVNPDAESDRKMEPDARHDTAISPAETAPGDGHDAPDGAEHRREIPTS